MDLGRDIIFGLTQFLGRENYKPFVYFYFVCEWVPTENVSTLVGVNDRVSFLRSPRQR